MIIDFLTCENQSVIFTVAKLAYWSLCLQNYFGVKFEYHANCFSVIISFSARIYSK